MHEGPTKLSAMLTEIGDLRPGLILHTYPVSINRRTHPYYKYDVLLEICIRDSKMKSDI